MCGRQELERSVLVDLPVEQSQEFRNGRRVIEPSVQVLEQTFSNVPGVVQLVNDP